MGLSDPFTIDFGGMGNSDPTNITLGGSPSSMPLGLPEDQQLRGPPPGFESTLASVQDAPQISSAHKIWNTIKQDSQSALLWSETEIGNIYQGTKNVVGTVATDITSPVTSALKTTYWYAIVAVVVLAGAIYFIGKGGAVKVNAII